MAKKESNIVLDYDDSYPVSREISKLFKRLRMANPWPLTVDQTLRAMVSEEDYNTITVANKTVAISTHQPNMLLRDRSSQWGVVLNFKGQSLHPKSSGDKLLTLEPETELIIRVWYNDQFNLAREYVIASTLFRKLNEQYCKTMRELRYCWAPIVPLMKATKIAGLVERASKHEEFVALANPPILPPEVRKNCRDSAAMLTKAMLLPDTLDDHDPEIMANILIGQNTNHPVWGDLTITTP